MTGMADPQYPVLQHFVSLLLQQRRIPARQDAVVDQPLQKFSVSAPVTATYFLFDPEPNGGVEVFLTHTLGRIVQQLSRSTEQRAVVLEGQVRGRVQWPATYKARYADTYNPNRYVCGEVYQDYNTPENQLLVYLLAAVAGCLRAVPPLLRAGMGYLPVGSAAEVVASAQRLGRMEAALQIAGRSARLRAVAVPPVISEFHLLRAQTARLEEYAPLAALYRQYRALVLAPTWQSLAQTARRILPLPASLDGQGETWVRLAAALWQDEAHQGEL